MDDRTMMDTILSSVKGACDLMMHGTIESLNAAMAAGIILWEVQRTAQDQNGGQ